MSHSVKGNGLLKKKKEKEKKKETGNPNLQLKET